MPNMRTGIEPGLLRIFRYFASIAVLYFAIISGYMLVTSDRGGIDYVQPLINFAINLILFIYLSWGWLEHRLRSWYLPLALVAYPGVTVFTNLIYLIDPRQTDVNLIIIRSWVLVPILLVPLVLIAWQYRFRYVWLYALFINLVELLILARILRQLSFETIPILGLPIIRAFAFALVGYIVVHLMDIQRQQKHKLIMTNIQLGQYANTLEQLAVSRERNRLARELHDTLAHTLSGLAVNLEGIKTMLSPDQPEMQLMLDQSLTVTRKGLDETRRALGDLRARPLDDLGLHLAVRGLVQAAADRAGFEPSIEISPALPNLPPDVEQAIYRIVQEALENITLHANAGKVEIGLNAQDDRLILRIRDDGCGFDPHSVPQSDRFGIRGIRERAAIVGGSVTIDSQIGRGTVLRFSWEKPNDKSPDL